MDTIVKEFIDEIGELPSKFTTTLNATRLTNDQRNHVFAKLLEVRELLASASLKMKELDHELLTGVSDPTAQDSIRLAEYNHENEYYSSVVYPITVAKLIEGLQNDKNCTDFCCS